MKNLWLRLAGIMAFQTLTIEGGGDGGDGGAGAGAGAGGGGGASTTSGGGGESTSTTPPTTTASPGASSSGAASLTTQEIASTLTDETGKPQRELGESSDQFLQRFRAFQKEHAADAATEETPEAKALREKAAKDKTAAAAAATAETPEAKAAREARERATAAETPEAKAAREKTEKEEAERRAAAAEPGGDFYDLAPIPTEALAKAIKEHPAETAAFLKATGLTEDQLYANSRLAGRAGEYMAAGLPTIAAAKHAVARANAFRHLDDSFTNIKPGDIPGTGKFVSDVLLPLTYLRDPETGEVMLDPDTKVPLTDGTAFTFMDNLTDLRHDFWAKKLGREGTEQSIGDIFGSPGVSKILDAVVAIGKKIGGDKGDELQAAAMILKGCGKAGPSASDEGLSPEVKTRLAEADRVKAEAATERKQRQEREAAEHVTKVNTFKESVLAETSQEFDQIIGAFLDTTSVKGDKFLRDTVLGKVRAALYANMSEDAMYLSQRDDITQRHGITNKGKKEWIALNLTEAKARLRTVSNPIFAEAGIRLLTKDEQRKGKIEGQAKSSQMETKGGTHTALPTAPAAKDDHELVEQAKESLRSRGEDVSAASVLQEFRKMKAAQATQAA